MGSAASENQVASSSRKKRQRKEIPSRKRSQQTAFEKQCAENGDELYEFETIETVDKLGPIAVILFYFIQVKFLVKWSGYGAESNTWEPAGSFDAVNTTDYFTRQAKLGQNSFKLLQITLLTPFTFRFSYKASSTQ